MNAENVFAQDSIDHLIARRLPAWLKVAATDQAQHKQKQEQLNAYHQALRTQQDCAQRLGNLLGAIAPLDAFAAPRLEKALADAGLHNVDVRTAQVIIHQEIQYPSAAEKIHVPRRTITSRQSLLAAALHNYHEAETKRSIFRIALLRGQHKAPLPLSFERFARLCRQLDLGGAYQALLHGVLAPKAHPGQAQGEGRRRVEQLFQDTLRASLEAAVHEARIKGELEQPCYQRLLPLFTTTTGAAKVTDDITPRQLRLLGKVIVGVVTVELEAREGQPAAVIAWIPGDPLGALSVHESWANLYAVLAERLRDRAYQQFFSRFIRQRDRVAFAVALARAVIDTAAGQTPELDGRNLPIDTAWASHVRRLQVEKLYDDARCLAVPTGEEDLQDRHERLEGMLAAGMDLLGLAGLFIPVVGELLLAVSALQVAEQVYEGYKDWRLGDRQGALDHAFGVAANLILFSATAHVVPAVARVASVDGLWPVASASGELKLAKAMPSVQREQSLSALMDGLSGGMSGELLEEEARSLSSITGISHEQVRRLAAEQAPAPARLLDSRERLAAYQADRTLTREALAARLASAEEGVSHEQSLLMTAFSGLTARGAQEVIEQACSVQLDRLRSTARVPLAMAERARCQVRDTRVDLACLGIRQARAINADTERLVLGLIERKQPWPADTRIELRSGNSQGLLLSQSRAGEAAQVKQIVRDEAGYRLADEERAPEGTEGHLLAAVLRCLSERQKAAMGHANLSSWQLRDWLLAAASADREQAAQIIGLVRPGGRVLPPRRFGDGRLGYALSTGGESSQQAIRRGIHRIFPTLSEVQLESYLAAVRRRGENPWDHYQRLQQQLDQLRESLRQWQADWQTPMDAIRRRRVADTFRRSWRRKLVDGNDQYELTIDGEHVGQLPPLPEGIEYAHVRRLALRDMQLQVIEPGFLGRFPNLVDLDLSHNRLTRVPEGIEQLTQLRRVNLGDNRIALGDASPNRLAQLVRLDTLILSYNPLNGLPDLSALPHVRDVRLRATGQVDMNEVHEHLTLRAHIDLRDNRIRELQREVRGMRQRLQGVSLHENPLTEQSAAFLDEVRGIASPGARGSASYVHEAPDADTRASWVATSSDTLRLQREATWNRLLEEHNSSGLFQFLADFAESEEFNDNPRGYRRRVWNILEACEHNEGLREHVFSEAQAPRSCEDRLVYLLNQLETGVLAYEGMEGVPAALKERRYLRLGRQLHRLDLLDDIAARHARQMRAQGVRNVDEIEVQLYYRSRLARSLDLPVAPDEMHYPAFANVTVVSLRRAELDVLGANTDAAIRDALVERPYWQQYLRETYADRFKVQTESFHTRLEALEAQARAGQEAGYEASAEALMKEHLALEKELIRALTEEAWARHHPDTDGV